MSGRKKVTAEVAVLVTVVVQNRQRLKRVDSRLLQTMAEESVQLLGRAAEVCFHLVSAREMARVNWQYLQHEGSTDVITFDQGSDPSTVRGEIFISVADAVSQAAEFGTTWQSELVRYVIHGLLHLAGFDDLEPGARRTMKKQEERLLRRLRQSHPAPGLGLG